MTTVFSGMLCEIFRGHKRARIHGRTDGRIAAGSLPYSLCRARRRQMFETMEVYVAKYPQFWDWVRRIHTNARTQVTEAGIDELLVSALYRSINQTPLPESPRSTFFDPSFDMIEGNGAQLWVTTPMGGQEDLGKVVYEIHDLWHNQLLAQGKKPGWGRAFDEKSDALFGQAGEILLGIGNSSDEVLGFTIAFGHLSMALPYVAYHAIDAIILTYGLASSNNL